MATLEQLHTALINADKAGDTEAAVTLTRAIKLMQEQSNKESIVPQRPLMPETEYKAPTQEPTTREKIIGTGEAGLSTATGLTSGALGALGGTAKGLVQAVSSGNYGKQSGADIVEKAQQEGAQALTYKPTTQAGQQYTEQVAQALEPLQALAPANVELQSIINLAKTARAIKNVEKPIETKNILPEKQVTTENIGELARKASEGDEAAKSTLAQEAKINPEALKSAERLGIDLPIDVYSDSELLRQTTGLARSQIGEESALWKEGVNNASKKATETMEEIGAKSGKDIVSSKVYDDLSKARFDIKSQAEKLYSEVDNSIPKETKIIPANLQETLNTITNEVGEKNLSSTEKSLISSVNNNDLTYGALLRMKNQIGDALSGKQSQNPFGNVDTASLKRLYGAIKNDQMDNVGSIAGADAREKLHFANRLTVKQKALEDRMVSSFGKEGEKSLAPLMEKAVTQASVGDVTNFSKLLKVVPEDMHKEVVATSLKEATQSKQAQNAGEFDFAKYSKLYQGLRNNPDIYSKVVKSLGGDDAHQIMTDLYQVSKKITDAKSNILTTGKANQAILNQMASENFINSIIRKTIQGVVGKATRGTVSIDGLFTAPKHRVKAVSEMFRSPEFKELAVQSAVKNPSPKKIEAFINSKAFKKWSSKVKDSDILQNPYIWVLSTMNTKKEEK